MIANSSSGSARDVPGRRDPADQRREGAGGAADDDVLRRPRLQPHGVDEDVEQDRDGEQRRRQPVGREAHQQHREDAEPDAEVERGLRGPSARAGSGRLAVRRILASRSASYHWLSAPHAPAPSAMHRIAVKPSTRTAADRRGEQPAQPGEHHQAHHARLGQREEVAPVGGKRGRIGHLAMAGMARL